MQCLTSRVNKVAWHEAAIRSQRHVARKPIAVNEKLTTRPPRWHVSEQRPLHSWNARPQQSEISNSFGVAAKTDSRGFATSHDSSRSYTERNVPCLKNGM